MPLNMIKIILNCNNLTVAVAYITSIKSFYLTNF